MDILEQVRRLERNIARGVAGAARGLVRTDGLREPLELAHAIVDDIEQEVQAADRGKRVFPFNTIDVALAAASDQDRARLDAVINGDVPLRDKILDRLQRAGCPPADLEVRVTYVPRPHRTWANPQFAITCSRVARSTRAAAIVEERPLPRLEVTVVNGAAAQRTFAFTSHRVDLGRGAELRDTRRGLIRTNHVAFADNDDAGNRTVSRQHAHIAYDAASAHFRVHDDGSAAGTRVLRRGRMLPVPFGAKGVRLLSGDEIVLGEARLRVRF